MSYHADGVRHDKSMITHPVDAEAPIQRLHKSVEMLGLAFAKMVLIHLVVDLLHTHVGLSLSYHTIFLQVCV